MIDEETMKRAENQLAQIEQDIPVAVEQAKQMPEGSLRSAWLGPLEALAERQDQVLASIDVKPVALPKGTKADEHEKALPQEVRPAYRRAIHRQERIRAAVADKWRKLNGEKP